MTESNLCPECGKELSPSAPRGLCPACLLKRGLETNTGGLYRRGSVAVEAAGGGGIGGAVCGTGDCAINRTGRDGGGFTRRGRRTWTGWWR